ncbi:histone H1.2-like [Crotalus tigris]|uniref:histone H1.2-like n=1 Tax=Crotalus tigris TaxID=88082 RepID=UPI00192F6C08|nr:histone H1.2-like [Crotalus tigris]
MMEPSAFPETPTLDASDDVAESPQTEDADEGPDSQNTPGSSESTAALDPLLHDGRNNSKKRATHSSKRAGRQLSQPRAVAPKPPTSNLSLLIYTAVATCQKKSGLSMQALKKIVTNMGYDMAKKKHYFLRSIKNMVSKGQLWQVKGTGATGSFKINPDIGKKNNPPKMKGKGPKTKHSIKKKKSSTVSKNGREAAKKQVKAEVKRTCRRGKMSSVQAAPSQVKV